MNEKVSKKSEINKNIKELIFKTDPKNLPQSFVFDRGIGKTHYRLTVETIENNFFVDEHGQKWAKVKE